MTTNEYRPKPTTPSPMDDYAAFVEWRYEVIAEICERINDEEMHDDAIND